ncbi:hypothetical protein JO972_08600 [Verrucomicrobiaceae bacterium 5K15]|uniref:DUF883 domain-containing protein n=1 Tax=Oceaniferula flava TaxID=2800421 RepID=A0AAE2SB98_9BACT|nr:hypothetical protein [Oceaniferula flavus]MBK1855016.1 hypothetical protein [Oceaniferula flavus]MBM1136322.1 hypothetical protein [Oceaniferula flavus]
MTTIETNPTSMQPNAQPHPNTTSQAATDAPYAEQNSQGFKKSVSDATTKAKEKTSTLIDDGSTRLGESIGHLSEASEKACSKIESGYQRKVAPAIHKASEKLADTSDYLKRSKPSDFADDICAKGKARPGIAAALLVGTGFLLGRMLTSRS